VVTGPAPAAGESAQLTVLFSPLRSIVLPVVVSQVMNGRTCRVRFEAMAAETSRLLRVELREARVPSGGGARGALAPAEPVWQRHAASLHVNQW
jgi:hypothetical protein